MTNQFNEMPRGFKGIWIPKEIWLHNELSFFEKALWAEIHSLDDEQHGCTASNEYLCKFFNIQEKTLQRGLAKLKNLGFVKVVGFDGRKRIMRASIKDIFVTSDPTPEKTIKDKFDTPSRSNLTLTLSMENAPYNKVLEQREEDPPLTPPLKGTTTKQRDNIFNKILEKWRNSGYSEVVIQKVIQAYKEQPPGSILSIPKWMESVYSQKQESQEVDEVSDSRRRFALSRPNNYIVEGNKVTYISGGYKQEVSLKGDDKFWKQRM